MHSYTFLSPLMLAVLEENCANFDTFCLLQTFATTYVVAQGVSSVNNSTLARPVQFIFTPFQYTITVSLLLKCDLGDILFQK